MSMAHLCRKIEVFIKTFNLDTKAWKQDCLWRLSLTDPCKRSWKRWEKLQVTKVKSSNQDLWFDTTVRTGGECDAFKWSVIVLMKNFSLFVFFYLCFTARQDYFIHFEPGQSLDGVKMGDPWEKTPAWPPASRTLLVSHVTPLSRRLTRWAYSIPMVRRRPHFQTWISLKPVGQSWSNIMCSITGVGERLHKVLGKIGSKLWFPRQQKSPTDL